MNDAERIESAILDMRRGVPGARDLVLFLVNDRVERIARRMLAEFPVVHRWFDTGDVRQIAMMKLCDASETVPLTGALHLYRLAALKIRQSLVDLRRQLCGPYGLARKEVGTVLGASAGGDLDLSDYAAVDDTHDPQRLSEWLEVHEAIGRLPEDDRQLFDLLWYNELSQDAAAVLLGIGTRQVKRRWKEAKARLVRAVDAPPFV